MLPPKAHQKDCLIVGDRRCKSEDSSDILSNVYIAGNDTERTPWYDTIPEPEVSDARTTEELFTKDYS